MSAYQPSLQSRQSSRESNLINGNAKRNEIKADSSKSYISDDGDERRVQKASIGSLWGSISCGLSLEWTLILSLIFGGCCSNVFALESIVKHESDSGLIVTAVQFLFTAVVAAWPQRHLSSSFPWILHRPKVPLSIWMTNAILFWFVNTMNNWAFGFNISVPVHIILRSGGSITTILVGFIWGKRYTKGQIIGVIILTMGVITAAISDAKTKTKTDSMNSNGDSKSFTLGLSILFVAQVLSAVMGLYTQSIYSTYGPRWEENLLWSHIFSLLFFSTMAMKIKKQLDALWSSPPVFTLSINLLHRPTSFRVPRQILFLAINSLTQFFCIQGVNRLATRTSALGVTIALNIRKLISLLLSIWIFGNQLKTGVWVGAVLVFLGGGVYAGWDAWVGRQEKAMSSKRKQQ